MKKSDTIAKLATALSKAQAEMPAAQMNAVNPFLKNRYADLGSVIETAKPILEKYGLSIAQFPIGGVNDVGVETILMHESGEWIANEMGLTATSEKGKSAAQVAGSIISYLRRYSYAAVLGMYADQDTDGNGGQQKQSAGKKKAPSKAESTSAPDLTPQFLVDNELSSNMPHAAKIVNSLGLAGKKATDENLALIAKYRKFKEDGMDEKSAFAAAKLQE